jgi:hypothetical protein
MPNSAPMAATTRIKEPNVRGTRTRSSRLTKGANSILRSNAAMVGMRMGDAK